MGGSDRRLEKIVEGGASNLCTPYKIIFFFCDAAAQIGPRPPNFAEAIIYNTHI
jgi:hypothetical protein